MMVGGFGLCGIPEHLIRALKEKKVKNLHVISSNAGWFIVLHNSKNSKKKSNVKTWILSVFLVLCPIKVLL
jgi:acyl CoA:acetate/3-ketoacid CoA transferase alpha subunit